MMHIPRIRVPRLLATSLGLMLFVSCTNPQWVCGCSPVVPGALVYGRVTLPDGTGATDALIKAQVAQTDCASPFRDAGEVRAQADGSYRAYVHGGVSDRPEGNCVRVYAQEGLGGAGVSDTVEIDLRFAPPNQPDSARVDLGLRLR